MKARRPSFDTEPEQQMETDQPQLVGPSVTTPNATPSDQAPNGFRHEIGDAIRNARQRAGLSRAQAARQCHVSPFIIQSVEAGTMSHLDPYLPLLAVLCSAGTQQDG